MIPALAVLLVFQLAGEILVTFTRVPVPGPVAGMLLLFLTLQARGRLPEGLRSTAEGLLSQLPLLFVPAGVGIMQHLSLLSREWLAIVLALAVSTLASFSVTAFVFYRVARWVRRGANGG